jgi:hypothetical protein
LGWSSEQLLFKLKQELLLVLVLVLHPLGQRDC